MAARVAVYSPSLALRAVTTAFFSREGLRVLARDRLPATPPHTRMIYIDIALAPPAESLRSFVIAARLIGSEVALCGHWTLRQRLQDAASALRLTAIEYPVNPRRFLEEIVVNPFDLEPDTDPTRAWLTGLAGRLYQHEGLVAELEIIADAVSARMADLLLASLPVYLQMVNESSEELAALAALLLPKTPTLFQPSALYRAVQSQLDKATSPPRIALWRPGCGVLTAGFSMITAGRAKLMVLDDSPVVDLVCGVESIPADFHALAEASFRPDFKALSDQSTADTRRFKTRASLAREGPFAIIIFPLARNAAHNPKWFGELNHALGLLEQGGLLILEPGERLLAEGLSIELTDDARVPMYRIDEKSRA